MPIHAVVLDLDIAAYERAETAAFVRAAAARVPVVARVESARSTAEEALLRAGVAAEVTAVVCLDDVEHGLPDPAGHLLAVARLNEERGLHESIVASDIVAVEDSAAGVEAASAAGLRCSAVAGEITGADRRITLLDASGAEELLG